LKRVGKRSPAFKLLTVADKADVAGGKEQYIGDGSGGEGGERGDVLVISS
jgi:hypothetical protein